MTTGRGVPRNGRPGLRVSSSVLPAPTRGRSRRARDESASASRRCCRQRGARARGTTPGIGVSTVRVTAHIIRPGSRPATMRDETADRYGRTGSRTPGQTVAPWPAPIANRRGKPAPSPSRPRYPPVDTGTGASSLLQAASAPTPSRSSACSVRSGRLAATYDSAVSAPGHWRGSSNSPGAASSGEREPLPLALTCGMVPSEIITPSCRSVSLGSIRHKNPGRTCYRALT